MSNLDKELDKQEAGAPEMTAQHSRPDYTGNDVQKENPNLDLETCDRIAAHANKNLHLGREWFATKKKEGWFNPPPKSEETPVVVRLKRS